MSGRSEECWLVSESFLEKEESNLPDSHTEMNTFSPPQAKKTLLAVIGTRPELIKMAPVVQAFQEDPEFDLKVCLTGQHTDLIESVQAVFPIHADESLALMTENQKLWGFAGRLLLALGEVIEKHKPLGVLAQGDTSTTFVAALAAFYSGVPFFHVEAGLRTHDLYNPYPEEANRVLAGRLASLHFAPTEKAAQNLYNEGVAKEQVLNTGNTVVDALTQIKARLKPVPQGRKRRILATVHRRENIGAPLKGICAAFRRLAERGDIEILLPVHPNPNVRAIVQEELAGREGITLSPPLNYLELLQELQNSYLVLTDSGGIQEEAPSFGKPTLILRRTTERAEAVEAGVAKLIGTEEEDIVREATLLLDDPVAYSSMISEESPFGDGSASSQIREAVRAFLAKPLPL